MEPGTIQETATHLHTWAEIIVFVFGFAGLGLSHWRRSVGTENEVKAVKVEVTRLADHVAKQNGKVGRTNRRMRKLEINCAAIHGVVLPEDDDPEEEDDEG